MAVRFDERTMTTTGVPQVVVDGVRQAPPLMQGTAHFDVSQNGTLVYLPGSGSGTNNRRRLATVDHDGVVEFLPLEPRRYYLPRVSPDGTRVALDITDERRDIWLYDLERNALNRLTFSPSADSYPVWMPNGRSLIIGASPAGGARNLFRHIADGSSPPERLTESDEVQLPHAVSRENLLVYTTVTLPSGSSDLAMLSLDGDADARRLTNTPFQETAPALSPDGQWLAYASNESGQFEVYVTQFPAMDGKWQVSTDGGNLPAWSPTRDELYFIRGRTQMEVVEHSLESTVSFEAPRTLFEGDFHTGSGRTYDLTADGERFIVIYREGSSRRDRLHVVINWHRELLERVPVG